MNNSTTNQAVKEYSPPYTSSVTFEYSDLLDFPDDGKRYEIINGELFMSPSPLIWHQRASMKLSVLLGTYVSENKLGEVFASPCDVLLSNKNVVQPDLVVVLNENKDIITKENIKGVPDFLIEILSPTNRMYDVKKKRALYEQYGVKEFWLVDPELETIQKLVLQDGRYTETGTYKEDEIIYECADLVYHVLVALGHKNISPDRIKQELARRFGMSGIAEKNSRDK